MNCTSWLRFMTSASEDADSEIKTKSVYCFTISPEMRRKGIAKQLLERVCHDAVNEGFTVVEAYPKKQATNVFEDNMGPLALYEQQGFAISKEINYSNFAHSGKPLNQAQ